MSKFFFSIGIIFLALPVYSQIEMGKYTLKFGISSRIRHEYWHNWKDADDDQRDSRNFVRVRDSLWGQVARGNASLYARLTNEFKGYDYFGGTSSSVPDKTASKKSYHFDSNEVVFDNLYFDYDGLFGIPLDVRLGRQDFTGLYGEGFLIYDGTPGDGSRTNYFNAAQFSLRINPKNTLDCIFLKNPRDEEYLPVANRLRLTVVTNRSLDKAVQSLSTTDETGGIFYWKNNHFEHLSLENYYIYKHEGEEGGVGAQAKKGKLNTFGTYAKYDFVPWVFRGQFAYEFGNYGPFDRQALGGYGFVDRTFRGLPGAPCASLGYVYLSGDDPSTAKNEGWDPLFSRYPWYSDLYSLSMGSETGISSYWTNLRMARAQVSFQPIEKCTISVWYNYLWADEIPVAGGIISGAGRGRGHLPQIKTEYAFNKNISTYFLAEYLIPGSFYKDDDPAIFLRTDITIKF